MVNFPSGLRELSQLGDGVLLAHLTDEIAQLMLDSRPSWPTLGFPAPVGPEPLPDATAGWWSAAQLDSLGQRRTFIACVRRGEQYREERSHIFGIEEKGRTFIACVRRGEQYQEERSHIFGIEGHCPKMSPFSSGSAGRKMDAY